MFGNIIYKCCSHLCWGHCDVQLTSRRVRLCVLSVSPSRDLQAEETRDSESEWEPHPAATLRSGPAQSPADPQPVWEPVIRVPPQTGSLEAPGSAGPVPQQDPERPLRGFRAAGHRDQPQPEPGKAGPGSSSERSRNLALPSSCHPHSCRIELFTNTHNFSISWWWSSWVRCVTWLGVSWLLLFSDSDLLPLPDFHPGARGVPLSPPEGPASGGELSRAVLHPSVHPEGLPGVSVLRGGKPVWGEEAQGPGGLRQGEDCFPLHCLIRERPLCSLLSLVSAALMFPLSTWSVSQPPRRNLPEEALCRVSSSTWGWGKQRLRPCSGCQRHWEHPNQLLPVWDTEHWEQTCGHRGHEETDLT